MKTNTKEKLICIIFSFACVLSGFSISHVLKDRRVSDVTEENLARVVYKNTIIKDRNGEIIYDGKFSESPSTRLSTFHMIGDKNLSIPGSLLTKTYDHLVKNSKNLSEWRPEAVDYTLSIDLKMQKQAYNLLTNNKLKGCIIVSDYTNGQLLCMASTPAVDVFSPENCAEGSYLNKATCAYAPGSTFKPITLAACIDMYGDEVKNFTYNCTGTYKHIKCYQSRQHGDQNIRQAFTNSCNCFFSAMAEKFLSATDLDCFVKEKLLDTEIIDELYITKGNIEASDDLLWSANGQSKTLISPLAISAFYNAIANNGDQYNYTVYLGDKTQPKRIISAENASFIKEALRGVASNDGYPVPVFAKSGTAQLDNRTSHSWYICSLDDPNYTVTVFIANGGNSELARSICKSFIKNTILQ